MELKTFGLKLGSVLIDDEDYCKVSSYRWNVFQKKAGHAAYVKTRAGKQTLLLHRLLIQAPKGTIVDHINGNGLDNRKCNLQLVDSTLSSHRRKKQKGCSSKYIGVSRHSASEWIAYIRIKRRNTRLGKFQNELAAAAAYNSKAFELYGNNAMLNNLV